MAFRTFFEIACRDRPRSAKYRPWAPTCRYVTLREPSVCDAALYLCSIESVSAVSVPGRKVNSSKLRMM